MGINWWSWLISTKPRSPHRLVCGLISWREEKELQHIIQCLAYNVRSSTQRALIASTKCYKSKIHWLLNSVSNSHIYHQDQTCIQLWNIYWAYLICGPCLQGVRRLVRDQYSSRKALCKNKKRRVTWSSGGRICTLGRRRVTQALQAGKRQELVRWKKKKGEQPSLMHALGWKRKGSSMQECSGAWYSPSISGTHVDFHSAPRSLPSHSTRTHPCYEVSLLFWR